MSFPGLGNAHSRKKGLTDAYDTDSSSAGSDEDDFDPTAAHDDTGEFRSSHRRKRRRTGQESRDDAALGVFGSDSEYEDKGPRGRGGGAKGGRPLRAHGMGFVKEEGGDVNMGDDDDEDEEEEEDETEGFAPFRKGTVEDADEDQDEEEDGNGARVGLGGVGAMGGMARRGLGLGAAYPGDDEDGYNEQPEERPRLNLGRSLGSGGSKAGLFKGFAKAGIGAGAGSRGTSTGGGNTPHQVASGASTPGIDHRGLGSTDPPLPAFESPLGQGFVSSMAHQRLHEPVPFASPQVQEAVPLVAPKPSFTDPAQQSRGRNGQKKGGTGNAIPNVNPNSFAARMMAKMGYVPGQGLGVQGQGILAPIEVKLRPQGAGVGAIKEKTEQAKAEARRAAALRGEALSDSDSEKERKARKKKAAGRGAHGTAHASKKKEKPKFKTADEIEKSAVGLKVPSVLKSIVDMTGPEAKVLDPALGVFTKATTEAKKLSPEEEEKLKIARMARRDLESFAAQWQGLQNRKVYANQEENRLTVDVDEQTEQVKRLTSLLELVEKMKGASIDEYEDKPVQTEEDSMREIVEKLETLQFQFKDEVDVYKLSEIAVAAIVPVFKQCMATWVPLNNPFFLTELLRRLRPLLKVKSREDIESRYSKRGYLDRPSKTATPYESLIYNLWLPKVRSAINNQWDVHDPSPVLSLMDAWGSLLPPFIHVNILDQLVMPKLKAAITEWNPRLESANSSSSRKKRSAPTPPPHLWIFPWLPLLNTETHLPSLLTDIKTKFTALLSSHPLASGPIQSLPEWTELLGPSVMETLLIRHLLPRLALLLRTELTINPAEQDLAPLDALWLWKGGFRASTLAQLLQSEMFPKWHNTLHMWLTTEGVILREVSAWYRYWQELIPADIRASPLIKSEFDKALDMINRAMDIGPGTARAKRELPRPQAGPTKPIKPPAEQGKSRKELEREKREKEKEQARKGEQVSFRDAIEDWCAENNLLLIPLRKADEKTGQPLFRITASASGGGGLVVYLRNDVVWGQDKKSRDKFEPLGLDKVLERIGHA